MFQAKFVYSNHAIGTEFHNQNDHFRTTHLVSEPLTMAGVILSLLVDLQGVEVMLTVLDDVALLV